MAATRKCSSGAVGVGGVGAAGVSGPRVGVTRGGGADAAGLVEPRVDVTRGGGVVAAEVEKLGSKLGGSRVDVTRELELVKLELVPVGGGGGLSPCCWVPVPGVLARAAR